MQRWAVLGGAYCCSVLMCFALEVQWDSESWRSCASQGLLHRPTAAGAGLRVLKAVLLGLVAGVEAVSCGAQPHSPCGMLLHMNCFRQ